MSRAPLALGAGEGRAWDLGRLRAVFKADGAETAERYSVSEWLLSPGQPGVGAHVHDVEDEVFVVMAGRPEILMGEVWRPCRAGDVVCIPAGVRHDFRNPGDEDARLVNVFVGAGFEAAMPAISAWFAGQEG